MNDEELKAYRNNSIAQDENYLYEVFFVEWTSELDHLSETTLPSIDVGDYVIALECSSYPMSVYLPAGLFIDSIRNDEPKETRNHKCYFCDYDRENYVTFLQGFLEAHETCEKIVRENLEDFIDENNDVFTASVI